MSHTLTTKIFIRGVLGLTLLVFLIASGLYPSAWSAGRDSTAREIVHDHAQPRGTIAELSPSSSPSEAPFIRQIQLVTKDLIVNPATQTIYASVPGGNSARDNSLTLIDPAAGTLGDSVFVGSDPNKLAMSRDGNFIYVGLDGEAAVRRFNVAQQAAELRFPLGSDSSRGPFLADDIEVLPGAPESVAISRRDVGYPSHEGVAIYDNGVQRPVVTDRTRATNEIEFSASAEKLYGFNSLDTGVGLRKLSVTPSGVSIISTVVGPPNDFGHIKYDGGLIYHSAGRVVEPEAGTIVGTYSGMNFGFFNSAHSVVVDAANNRVYFLTGGRVNDFQQPTPVTIYAFNRTTFDLTGSIQISGTTSDVSSLVRWGANGLAFRDSSHIYLIQTSLVPSSVPVPTPTPTPSSTPTPTPTPLPTPLPGELRQVSLATKDLVVDSVTQTIYASVPSSAGAATNSITPIDAATGTVGTPVFVGSNPNKLAISDDNKFIYVALDDTRTVRRYDVVARAAGLEFPVDSSSFKGTAQLAVMPGNPQVVAMVRQNGTDRDVALYDNGVQRPLVEGQSTSFVAFANVPSVLYGYNAGSTSYDFRKMAAESCGLGESQAVSNLISGNIAEFKYDNGRIYWAGGRVLDPEAFSVVGNFNTPENTSYPPLVETDSKANRIYSLVVVNSAAKLRVFDMQTFALVGELSLPSVTGQPTKLLRWGTNGLTFRTDTQVFLLQDALIANPSASFTPAPPAVPATFTIKGRISSLNIPEKDVTITFSGTRSGTVQTDADGYFTISNLPLCGALTITPSKRYYDFSPKSITITKPATQGAGFSATHRTVGFVANQVSVNEGAGRVYLAVSRTGDPSSGIYNAATISYTATAGTASDRSDYAVGSGTFRFDSGVAQAPIQIPIIDDLYVEGPETFTVALSDVTGIDAELINPVVTVTILDNDTAPPTTNPLDSASFFVRQQYLDFLNREPDQSGLDYWRSLITSCPSSDTQCINVRRVSVSAAFFIEQEFQLTGNYVYRMYKAAYGQRPSYAQFLPDRARINPDVAQIEASKQQFADLFVQRPEFLARYPSTMTPDAFIDALIATVKTETGGAIDLTSQRAALLSTLQASGRATVVRQAAENTAFQSAEYNKAFVTMQYFGYLRRDPEDGGYNFWLDVLNNRVANNYRGMVCAFVTSAEYQARFSSVITRNDSVCGQIGQ